MKRLVKIWAVTLMVVIASGLAGCGGGGAEVKTQSTTLGQELMDLEDSYKKGIITAEQYEELKKNAIKKAKR